MRKKGMSLITQSLFAIFMVMFVFFIVFIVLGNRSNKLQAEQQFQSYDQINTVLLTVLSNSNCLSIGNRLTVNESNAHTTVQGLLDSMKLDSANNENKDLWCVENFNFIYNLEIVDDSSNKWRVGPINVFNREDVGIRKVRLSLPGVVRYPSGITYGATIMMNAFVGSVPSFYGAIKEACVLQKSKVFSLETRQDLRYIETNNSFYVNEEYFFPYFSCSVSNFSVSKGRNLIYMEYNNGRLEVKT